MRQTWGIGVFLIMAFCIAGLTLAQGSQGKDKRLDQPITKAQDNEAEDEEEEDDEIPDPPPSSVRMEASARR